MGFYGSPHLSFQRHGVNDLALCGALRPAAGEVGLHHFAIVPIKFPIRFLILGMYVGLSSQ